MKNEKPILVWFRQDLRIYDNPALYHAAKTKQPLILLYIVDDELKYKPGGASKWWLHHSLDALTQDLNKKYQASLVMQSGAALHVINKLINQYNIEALYWNRCYEPDVITRDTEIKKILNEKGITVHSFNGALLKEPWEITNKSKQPFKVFTPFWKTLYQMEMREILSAPKDLICLNNIESLTLKELKLLPTIKWDQGIKESWTCGENAAKDKLKAFLKGSIAHYKAARDFPALESTSCLSPHLHFGEISPIQIWHATMSVKEKSRHANDMMHFLSELAWREFSYHLLYHFPALPEKAFKAPFNHFPWQYDKKLFKAWQKGQTGYPIVDAGMRQLWHTGWMHNRVRMIVASFLIKHLLLPWQEGEKWFWDTLVDADLANNAASWQWVAGSGADAAPYFRIFNPVLQGEKFDINGDYVKKWVPEISKLTPKYLHRPWEAPSEVLKQAGITLGKTYPFPLVEHDFARKRALEAYKELSLRQKKAGK